MAMSEEFQKQEVKNKKEADVKVQEEINKSTIVYWAPAVKHQVANYVKEERSGGHIMRGEEPLVFTRNMYIITYDGNELTKIENDKKVAHIEASRSFKNGLIKRCKSIEEAQIMSAGRKARRLQKDFDITSGGPDGFDGTLDGKKITKVVGA